MNILLYTDVHLCARSSVIRTPGERYSMRLENIIECMAWINQLKKERNCKRCFCLGDYFDRPDLNAEELTALKEIDVEGHEFIVGNHEGLTNDLRYASSHIFNSMGATVYSEPTILHIEDKIFLILPYAVEADRIDIDKFLTDNNITDRENVVILSHNDIKGIQYGAFVSQSGYEIEDIKKNCSLCVNGHIHNGAWLDNKLLNLGSLTGLNFSNDADKWQSVAAIYDTETGEIELINNPYAFNFFKAELKDMNQISNFLESRSKLANSIISIKVPGDLVSETKELISKYNFIYSRVLADYSKNWNRSSENLELNISTNYFQKFKEFLSEKYNDRSADLPLMLEELNKAVNGNVD